MRIILSALVQVILLIIAGCVEEFTPVLPSVRYYLVVNGLITDQPEVYTVRLSWSITPGENSSVALPGCDVKVYDDAGNIYQFTESSTPGLYLSDTTTFRGEVGRKYKLHINTNNASPRHYSYESESVEMKAVTPIDSLYYEKILIEEPTPDAEPQEACQIYLNTYDPVGDCSYYRWDYSETWRFEIPYFYAINRYCWASSNSQNIDVKSTVVFSESRVNHHPIKYISNETDRLSIRYSINVNQYSINENEFEYWEKIRMVTQDVGGLYDHIPSSINGNLFCIEDPAEPVLGYFSVSGKASKRIYIDEILSGFVNPYKNCCWDTVYTSNPTTISGLNEYVWICTIGKDMKNRDYITVSYAYKCVDCTVRGTNIRPEFWEDFK